MRVLKANLCSVLLCPPPQAAPPVHTGQGCAKFSFAHSTLVTLFGVPLESALLLLFPSLFFSTPFHLQSPFLALGLLSYTLCGDVTTPDCLVLWITHFGSAVASGGMGAAEALSLCTAQREWWFINFESLC